MPSSSALIGSWLVVLAAACGSARTDGPTVRAQPREDAAAAQGAPVKQPECRERLEVDQATSVLSEQRRIGPPAFDFQARFAAAYLDPAAQVPVEVVRAYQIGATPLLWWNVAKTEAVVNAAVLTELVVADVTQLRAGQQVQLGQLTELGLGKLGGRELVKFLIYARIIATYVHIGAELCLVEDHDGADGYRARFTGQHTYFTNDKNVEPLAFTVAIDPAGVISVRGE